MTRCDPDCYGLLQPLEKMSLDEDALRTAKAAAVAYCDDQGAKSVADLLEHANTLITVAGLGSVS